MILRQATLVRDRTVKLIGDALFALRVHVTMLPELERDILDALEPVPRQELTIEITNLLLNRFNHQTSVKDPRFDKTRRALAKKTLKGPRGVTKPRQAAPEPAAMQESAPT